MSDQSVVGGAATAVSIIVRTLNEARHLPRLFAGIRAQTFKSWEVVLVDSGSTDGTVELAAQHTPHIHHIPKEEFTFGRSLNLGCAHARGRYLVFVSAHTYPLNNTWLGNLVRPFDDATIGMVYGRQRALPASRIAEQRDLERLFDVASKILINEAYGHNGNAAVRRDLWEQHAFDETLTGLEDIAWARAIQQRGLRVYYAGDAAVYHVHNETLRQVYRRAFREGLARRRMFPGMRFERLDVLKEVVGNIAGDLLFGLRRRAAAGLLAQVPSTRGAESLGKWHGLTFHKKLTRELLTSLYYPKLAHSVVIHGAGRHGVQETEVPTITPDDVLIQVAYVGVCATDLEVAEGRLPYYQNGHAQYPVVPGHEYSGVVVEVGARVRHLRKGDKVVGECAIGCGTCPACEAEEDYRCARRKEVGVVNMNGAYARYLRVPGRYVHRLPRQVMLKQAALIEPLAVCLKGLRKLDVTDGQGSACIVGAGPLGNLCAQVLRHRGLTVTVIDHDAKRLALLQRYDVNTQETLDGLDAFDYLIDASGDEEVLARLIEQSKASAKILLLGLPYDQRVPVLFASVPCYDKTIIGSIASQRRDWQAAIELMRRQVIDLDDHTAHVLPLEAYESAWSAVRGHERFKVLLTCSSTLTGM
jgi:2-desacetyl-2-hydroxyethyl bacteriochlorophyllide A dehydrogenase